MCIRDSIMPGINDEYDLGYYYANEAGIYSEKDLGPLADYIDYERYGLSLIHIYGNLPRPV